MSLRVLWVKKDPVDVTFRFTPAVEGVQETTFEVDPCTLCPPVTLKATPAATGVHFGPGISFRERSGA